jgi:ABC-2 type transport system ATP-binding protein
VSDSSLFRAAQGGPQLESGAVAADVQGGPQWGPTAPGAVLLEGVGKRFRDRAALRSVSLSLGAGVVGALVGPNGSGKTTLLRILAGVVAADQGRVEICRRPPGRGDATFVPPGDRGLFWRLTGRQNLEFFARLSAAGGPDMAWHVEWAAGAIGVSGLLDRRVGTYSTGERRRLTLARAFVTRAPVLLLDEPYADLDEGGRAEAERLVRLWTERRGTVLYAAPVADAGPPPDVTVPIREGTLWVPAG